MPITDTIFENSADTDTLGSRIMRAREASGIPLAQIAKTLGLRKSTVEAWESDRSAPRAHHLMRVAGMVGISPSWLLGGMGEAPALEGISEEVKLIRMQIGQIKAMRDQTTNAINNIEMALGRLVAKEAS